MDAAVEKCLHCEKPITRAARGRPQRFCCDAHRKTYSRLNGHENSRPGLSHRVGEKSLKSSSQAIEIGSDFFRKMLSPKTNLCASKS